MKFKNYLYIIFYIYCNIAIGQNRASIQAEMEETIPKEKAYIEVNSEIILAGETLYYKLFCLFQDNNMLSSVSKIAYVELIDKKTNSLFKHKLRLVNGLAYGDFFIPPSLSTGNYKIVGYTQWMNNNKKDRFFLKDIYIINPYIPKVDNLSDSEESVINIKLSDKDLSFSNLSQSEVLKTDSKIYKTRSKVNLNLNNLNNASIYGNYTLSVKKVDRLNVDSKVAKNSIKNENISLGEGFYLPELRGEIISGKVIFKKDNSPLVDKIIALSIPDKIYVYKNVQTDASGNFIFNLGKNYTSTTCFLQVLDSKQDDYKIVLDDKSFKYRKELKFHKILLNSNIEEWLLNESVSNQIENAFNASKLDSTITQIPNSVFFASPTVTYRLDDYKRFPTLKETFVEVVEGAAIRKKKDTYNFKVFFYEGYINYPFAKHEPLVLLDGVFIQDKQYLIDYDPYKIEKVSLLKGSYFYGPKIYNGIIDIRTKKAAFLSDVTLELKEVYTLKLDAFQDEKIYYSPNYGDHHKKELKRIPDFRRQLLWMPEITLNQSSKQIEFYTSDAEGIYEIVLKGYNNSGNYLAETSYFKVVNND